MFKKTRLIALLTIILLTLIFGNEIHAQNTPEIKSSATPSEEKIQPLNLNTTSENNEGQSQHSLGILDLEEHIASNRFNENSNLEGRGILVRVYERIALATCFPPISDLLKGKTLVADARCNEIMEKLSKLHSNNTILICAQSGVNSVDCARSYETQSVRKYKQGEADHLNLTLKAKSALALPEVKARFTILQKKLIDQLKGYKKQFSITALKELDSTLFSVLAIICGDDALELTTQKASVEATNNRPFFGNALPLAKEIESLGQGNNSTKPTTSPTKANEEIGTVFFRTRILSAQCYDTILDVLNTDSRLSAAICFRDGFIAPSCLSALKRIQSLKEPAKDGSTPVPEHKSDGLASF